MLVVVLLSFDKARLPAAPPYILHQHNPVVWLPFSTNVISLRDQQIQLALSKYDISLLLHLLLFCPSLATGKES